VSCKLFRQRLVRLIGFRHHHQPAGILVETVHNAGPPHAANARQAVAAMGDQRVDKRAIPVARSRMYDQAGRLVNDNQMFILKNDIKRYIFGLRDRINRLRHIERNEVARLDPVVGCDHLFAIELELAGLDQRLQARPAELAKLDREVTVYTLPRLIIRDREVTKVYILNIHINGSPGVPTMTTQDDSPDAPVEGTVFNNRQVRILKFVVIGMGVLLLLGFAVVVITIVYQASQMGNSSSTTNAAVSDGGGAIVRQGGAGVPETIIPLAKGMRITGTSFTGGRLAVTLKKGDDTTVLIINTRTGKILSRVLLVPER